MQAVPCGLPRSRVTRCRAVSEGFVLERDVMKRLSTRGVFQWKHVLEDSSRLHQAPLPRL